MKYTVIFCSITWNIYWNVYERNLIKTEKWRFLKITSDTSKVHSLIGLSKISPSSKENEYFRQKMEENIIVWNLS